MNIFNRRLRVLGVTTGLLLSLGQLAAADPIAPEVRVTTRLLGLGELGLADSIGPDCDTCQGGIFTLESFLLDDNAAGDLYTIRLTMNTAGLTTSPGQAVAVDSVAVKTTAQSDAWVGGFNLFAAPGGQASWSQMPGGLNAGGCQDGNDNGFFCEDWIGAGVGAPVGGTLVFLWTGLVDPSESAERLPRRLHQGALRERRWREDRRSAVGGHQSTAGTCRSRSSRSDSHARASYAFVPGLGPHGPVPPCVAATPNPSATDLPSRFAVQR